MKSPSVFQILPQKAVNGEDDAQFLLLRGSRYKRLENVGTG
jgi:hypothetical protein